MPELVTYHRDGPVSTITMDDGKVNVFSIPMLEALHEAFGQAERDGTTVLLVGRPGSFSAGFDLNVIKGPSVDVVTMLTLGARLAERVLSFPAPVAAVCTGHCYPAGAFLLLSADVRVGVDGPYRIGLNEVRIGLTLPWFAVVLARHRLTPPSFDRTTVTGALYGPAEAARAGFLDVVVPPDELDGTVAAVLDDLALIDRPAHAATKLRVRDRVLTDLRAAIDSEWAAPRRA
jgi:enoyl-CoA hydratase